MNKQETPLITPTPPPPPNPIPPPPPLSPFSCLSIRCGAQAYLYQRIKLGIEVHRPRAVNDAAVDMCPKVDLADVVVLQHRLIARVGRPVSCYVVERTASWECTAASKPIFVNEGPRRSLEALADINHLHSRLDKRLHVLSDLPMCFCCSRVESPREEG